MSKGSKPRPFSVSDEVFSNNFDSIFPRDSAKRQADAIELHEKELGAKVSRIIGETIADTVIADYEARLKLKGAGYESCKETDTDRTDAAKNRALVNR